MLDNIEYQKMSLDHTSLVVVTPTGDEPVVEVLSPNTKRRLFVERKFLVCGVTIVLLMVTVGVVLTIWGSEAWTLLEGFEKWCDRNVVVGVVIISVTIFIFANLTVVIPLVYAIMLLFAGYQYGWAALLVTYPSAYLGGLLGFYLFRHNLRSWTERKIIAYPRLALYRAAIGEGGLQMVMAIRLAPLPFGGVTALLAVSPVKTTHHAFGLALSCARQVIHVGIGQSVRNIKEFIGGDAKQKKWEITLGCISVAFMVIIALWARRIIQKRVQGVREEGAAQRSDSVGEGLSERDATCMEEMAVNDLETESAV